MQTHEEYLDHLRRHITSRSEDKEFRKELEGSREILLILENMNLDAVIPLLTPFYCPTVRRSPRDPICMLRALILMLLIGIAGITKWVRNIRSYPLFAILAGFDPDDTPGVGTFYDFMKRIIYGPWEPGCSRISRDKGPYRRSLRKPAKKDREKEKADDKNPHQSQSAKLAKELREHAEEPRPEGFPKILTDILLLAGVIPSAQAGLITELGKLAVSGDGSVAKSGASPAGKPTCTCRADGVRDCDHPRSYSSATAAWCYDHHHGCYVFGDRYYQINVCQNGHDFPLITIMPGGNESDFTLSLKAADSLRKASEEHDLGIAIAIFIGDGHHDSYGDYEYFSDNGIIPVVPLSANMKCPRHLPGKGDDVTFGKDGIPLCPGGKPMRHHEYDSRKQTHIFACGAKRGTHRDGKFVYVMHTDECPAHADCKPESSIGPMVRVKADTDPRIFPPIPRDSALFKDLMKQRSASERANAVLDRYPLEGTCRNADQMLIRITLANLIVHAKVRIAEAAKNSSGEELFADALRRIGVPEEQIAAMS